MRGEKMHYKIIVRINSKQVDQMHARNIKAANYIVRKIAECGYWVYDVKNIKRVNIAIAKLKGKIK